MSPAAEALLASSLGTRPSLGHPGAKYEMGLEAVEQIEVIAAELAAEVFDAPFAEVRVGSGALANLYAFMACCDPGDAIIVPPGVHRRPRHPPLGGSRRALRLGRSTKRRSTDRTTRSTSTHFGSSPVACGRG